MSSPKSSSTCCPICFESFPVSVLEVHAANCFGKEAKRTQATSGFNQSKPTSAANAKRPRDEDVQDETQDGKKSKVSSSPADPSSVNTMIPLAERMRPADLSAYVGQEAVTAAGGTWRPLLEGDPASLPSLVLWGPPGCGKTSLANVIALRCRRPGARARFVKMSACTAGVADVREMVKQAVNEKKMFKRKTLLFMDEVHR